MDEKKTRRKDSDPPVYKETANRDERGARKQNYRRFKEGRDYEAQDAATASAMLEMMRIGLVGEIRAGGGERVRMGRPPKYEDINEFIDKINEYLEYIQEKNETTGARLIPDVEGFCLFAGIDRTTLLEWEKSRGADFSRAIKCLKNAIAAYKKQLAAAGKMPAVVFAIDMNNNHGYTQAQTVDIRTQDRLRELPSRSDVVRKLPRVDAIGGGDDIRPEDLE